MYICNMHQISVYSITVFTSVRGTRVERMDECTCI